MNENMKFEPIVKLGNYKGLKIKKLTDVVTEEEVMAQIDAILNEETVLEPKTEGVLELGDTAVFDFEGFNQGVAFEGGKALGHEMEIGSGQFIPGFEDQMVGMKLNEEKDINVVFPTEYHEPTLAGAPAVFKVKLNEIKVSVKPELTDEWVESLGNDEKTIVEFKTAVENDLLSQKMFQNKNQTIAEALNLLASTSEVQIPEGMIDHEFAQAKKMLANQAEQYGLDLTTYITLTGMTEEQVNEQLLNESKARVLNSVIISEVTKLEKFNVTEEEIAAKYLELSNQYGIALEEVKQHLNDELVKIDIEFTKAVELIYDNIDFQI